MSGGDSHMHPSVWGNPRAEQALSRLNDMRVPEVSARTMRRRLRGVPAALPPVPALEPALVMPGATRSMPVAVEPAGAGPADPGSAAPRRGRSERSRRKRPPASFEVIHDWRWVVGGIGRVLVSIGLLIFAFVAYQLWGTGIQYARAQDQLESEFTEQLADYSTVAAAPGEVSTLPQLPGSSDPPAPTDLAATTTVVPDATGGPPDGSAVPSGPALSLALGDLLGRIEIPAISVDDYIVAGVRGTDLAKGVGHYPYTPLPGNTGNSAIAGHRTTHGQPFFNLDKLVAGDQIVVTTVQGRFVYAVTGSKVVEPTDFTVLYGTSEEATLTLTTCHPRYSQKKRLVVSATLASEPSEGAAAVIEYTPEAVEESDPTASIPGDGTADTVVDGSQPADATIEAFSNGWFSDPDAWPQIAMWGGALTAVALFATWVGRRSRKWISVLLFISPFVVLLYFWFENVNRLLPPNL